MPIHIKPYAITLLLMFLLSAGCVEEQDIPVATDMTLIPQTGEPSTSAPADDGTFEPEMLGITPGVNTSELRFTWYSDISDDKTGIRLFSAGGELIKDTTGINARAGSSSSAAKRYHKAELTGLEPGASYKYSVSSNGTDWSYRYDIKIPAPGPFRFAAISDPQIDLTDGGGIHKTEWMGNVSGIAARGNVSLIVSGGDQVDAIGGNEDEYAAFFSPPQLRSIPFAPAMGNHDWHMHFVYHFNLPNATASISNQHYYPNYWYLYNNVLFIALNTGLYFEHIYGGATTPEKEVDRFDSLLTAATGASAGKYDWLIVQHHRSTRSVGPHSLPDADDRNTINYRNAGIEGVIEKHGADLVISGHDHLYVRSHPLKDGKVVEAGKGTVYLTLSAATEYKQYPSESSLIGDWVALNTKMETSFSGGSFSWRWKPGYGHAVFDVTAGTISVKVYTMPEGSLDDSFELTKSGVGTSILERERTIPYR